jgi:hypothetical protein
MQDERSFEWYQPATGKWIDLRITPVDKKHIIGYQTGRACYGNGMIFLYGQTTEQVMTFESYDMTAGTWTSLPLPIHQSLDESMHFYDNKVYLFGELHSGFKVNTPGQFYDVKTRKWSVISHPGWIFPSRASAFLYEGKIYWLSGMRTQHDERGYTLKQTRSHSCEYYDCSKNSWHPLPDAPEATTYHAIHVAFDKGLVYLANGAHKDCDTSSNIHIFSLREEKWLPSLTNPTPHARGTVCVPFKQALYWIWPEKKKVVSSVDSTSVDVAQVKHSYTIRMYCRLYIPLKDLEKLALGLELDSPKKSDE